MVYINQLRFNESPQGYLANEWENVFINLWGTSIIVLVNAFPLLLGTELLDSWLNNKRKTLKTSRSPSKNLPSKSWRKNQRYFNHYFNNIFNKSFDVNPNCSFIDNQHFDFTIFIWKSKWAFWDNSNIMPIQFLWRV